MRQDEPLASLAALHAALEAVMEDRFRLTTMVPAEAHDRFTSNLIHFALSQMEARRGRQLAVAQARAIIAAWGSQQ